MGAWYDRGLMRPPKSGPLGLCLLGLVILISGCAYFNTFYLAKKYYKEGQKAQERSVLESVAPEASTKYEMSIRQCQKVLTDYGKSKWADDALFLQGAATFGKGDYPVAIRRLEDLQERFPKSPFVPEARLIRGMAHLKRRNYAEADSIFEAVDRDHPKLERRGELYYYAAESRAAQRDYAKALTWYARAVEAAGSRREKADVLRRTGDVLLASGRADSAIYIYAEALKAEERSKYRLDLALRRAEALRDLKRYDDALALLAQWRPNAIAEKREGELMLRLHDVQARVGRTQEAISGYRRLIETMPNTPVAADAQFRVGYLYESALNDYEGAAKEYEKLKTGPPSEFQSQANRRSQGLASLKKYRESLGADTTQAKARSAFLLAELYYFQLERPDSALLQYAAVEHQYPQSVYAPKSAYARLWITALDRSDTLAVRQMTDNMAVRYRGTRFAESALYFWKGWSGATDERTALLDSLLANPDTTGASRFAPEEPEAAGGVTAAAASADSTFAIPPDRMNQLTARREAILRQGRVGAKNPPLRVQPTPADSLRAARTDSLRAAQPDSVGAAPPDTTAPSSPPPKGAPADSIPANIITPQR